MKNASIWNAGESHKMTVPHFPFFRPQEGALPPEEVRITELRGEPDPQGMKVRVFVGVTPFQQPPHITITLNQPQSIELAFASIIEPANLQNTFILHANPQMQPGEYFLEAELTYPETEIRQIYKWAGSWQPGSIDDGA